MPLGYKCLLDGHCVEKAKYRIQEKKAFFIRMHQYLYIASLSKSDTHSYSHLYMKQSQLYLNKIPGHIRLNDTTTFIKKRLP